MGAVRIFFEKDEDVEKENLNMDHFLKDISKFTECPSYKSIWRGMYQSRTNLYC